MADYYELDPSLNSEKREAGPSTLTDKNLQEALLVLEKREKEVDTLRQQLSEILRINHQWDQEYKELKRLYDDSTTCVPSNTTTNGVMDIKKLQEQLMTVKSDRDKIDRKYGELKLKYDNLKKQYSELLSQYKQSKTPPPSSPPHQSGTIRTLQEDKMILTSQVEAYKEDYEAEKRDKDKVIRERETERLRYEAEIASLKIQLDRSTSELVRYKGEAVILGQQLRLKQQREDEEYRKHLEKQGYSSRKPLPPLDPFVEKDVRTLYYSHSDPIMTPPLLSPTTPTSTRLSGSYKTHMSETRLHRGAELIRRTSIPLMRPSTIDLTTPHKQGGGEGEEPPLRSVSPQIHRLGNYRLYSRESDPDLDTTTHSTNYSDPSLSHEGIERRIELDLPYNHNSQQRSLSADNSPLGQ